MAMNITLSVGDVSFHLAPAPPGDDGHEHNPRPSPPSRGASALSSHRKRQLRRRGFARASPFDRQQQQQRLDDGSASNPPIIAIRHAGNASATFTSSSSSGSSSQRAPSSPQSPLQRHILGRVRAMRDRIESQDGIRRSDTRAAAQSPLFSKGDSGDDDYCVDLSSFTGTLRISSTKNVDSAQTQNGDSSPWQEKRKSLSSPRHVRGDSIVLSKKRTRRSSAWMHSIQQIGADAGNGDEGIELVNSDERADSGCSDSKKSVRFSMLQLNNIIDLQSGKGEDAPGGASTDGENNDPNNTTQSQAIVPSPSTPTPLAKKLKTGSFFFSSPPSTFTSPPRAAAAIARESTSLMKRSGKHVLRQITLAGKDAYDALNGDGAVAPSSDATAGNDQSGTPRTPRAGSGAWSDSSGGGDFVYDSFDGTELHYACGSDSLDDLKFLLEHEIAVGDLYKSDCEGRLPIHVLAENRSLIEDDPIGCEEAAMEMVELMGPEKAVQSLHPSGLAPFVYVIGRWTKELHRGALLRNITSFAMRGAANKRLGDSSAPQPDEENRGSMTTSAASSNGTPPRRSRVTYRSLFTTSGTGNERRSLANSNRCQLLYLPSSVTVSDHVRWAIRILSRLIDEYPEQCREAILTNVASVPLFLKSLLLISDYDDVAELLDTSLVKHAVMDKRSINVWLCAMLTDSKEVKMRAVTFLKLLSQLTLQDLAAASQSPDRYSDKEIERFTSLREGTFNAVYVMPGIVPAVLELGGHMIENLSNTNVMRYITDRTIRKDNVFFVLICDFFYSIFMLMGYRLNVEFVLNYQNMDGPENYNENSYISTSTMGIAGYFLLKEGLTFVSLYLTSRKLAKRYCLSVFNIIDISAVAMLLGSAASLTANPSLFIDNEGYAASLTIILLWLKVMGAFKILNAAFSLFLYAVREVIKEVKWFIVFLIAITLMFADAARTVVAARGDCEVIEDGDYITEEFCSDNLLAVVTRMYSVLVGDVALEYFQSSDAMVTVFVFFSFFSIIILLNILIAIIIDTYDSSKQRSREIFYRARIEYAAHLVARKQFLSPRERSDFHVATYVPQKVRLGLRFVYALVSAAAFLSFQYGFFGAVYFLTLESKHDSRMIRSLMIIYVCVGAIFNAYVLAVLLIALFSKYDKQYNRLNRLVENRNTLCHRMMSKWIRFLEMTVKTFHRILGFNADSSVDEGVRDVSDKRWDHGEARYTY